MKISCFVSGAIALLGIAPACGSSSSNHSSTDAQGVPDAPDTLVVTVTDGVPPDLIAFRDDRSTEWVSVPVAGLTTIPVTTHGAYQIAVACDFRKQDPSQGVEVIVFGRTAQDDAFIRGCPRLGPAPFEVTGGMVQGGQVALDGSAQTSALANWAFDLPVYSGTFDLVLLPWDSSSLPSGIAFHRDLAITGNRDLGTIDLSQETIQPLIPVSYTVPDVQSGESLRFDLSIIAGNTQTLVSTVRSTSSVVATSLVPDSALQQTDSQYAWLYDSVFDAAASLTYFRDLSRYVRVGDSTSWALPDPLGPVTLDETADGLTATWSKLPDADEITLFRESDGGSVFRLHEAVLSRSFLAAAGGTSATVDVHAIPGFQSDWQLDPTGTQIRQLRAFLPGSASESSDVVVERFTPAPPASGEAAAVQGMRRFAPRGALDRASKIWWRTLGRRR